MSIGFHHIIVKRVARRSRTLALLAIILAAEACRGSSANTPVTPTIGTVATLQGTVVRAGSYTPLSGVIVSVGGVTLITRSDGTYAISGLKPGDALLTADRGGFEHFSEHVHLEGALTVNIVLTPAPLS